MGVTEVVDTIVKISNGATAINSIKESAKSIHSDAAKAIQNSGVKRLPVSVIAPASVKVGEPVTIHGTGVGLISLYSDGVKIRELFPGKDGHWYAREYFGKAGKYIVKATDYYGSAEAQVQAD